MGKIFVLSVTDHEEYILSRIMEIIAAEPEFDHIVSSHPCNTLVFPGLELGRKDSWGSSGSLFSSIAILLMFRYWRLWA